MFWEKLFTSIKNWVNNIDKDIRIKAANSVKIVQFLHAALNNPAFDLLVALTPTQLDNEGLSGARQWLEKALPYVMIVDKCKEEQDLLKMVNCFLSEVAKLPKHMQDATWAKLQSLLTALQDGKEIDPAALGQNKAKMSYYDTVGQNTYVALIK